MPFTEFTKIKDEKGKAAIEVCEKGHRNCFVAHTSDRAEAHRIAGLRELAAHGKLRVAK